MGGGCGGLSRMMARFQQDGGKVQQGGGEVLVGWCWFKQDGGGGFNRMVVVV